MDNKGRRGYISLVSEIANQEREGTVNDVLRAIADPTRREILKLLRARDLSAGEIAKRFPLAKSTFSGHFNVLRHAGLIVAERRGTTILYSLNQSALEESLSALFDLFRVGKPRKERRR